MPERRYRLSDEDVAALFMGKRTDAVTAASVRSANRLRPVAPRYCQACGEVREDLLSFRGDRDWAPTIAVDAPVRALVKQLRNRDSTPWVSLCTLCIGRALYHNTEDGPHAA